MRRLSLLVLIAVASCAKPHVASPAPHHLMASAGPVLSAQQIAIYRGTPDAPTPGSVAIISNDGHTLLQQNSDGTTQSIGGGSGAVSSVTGNADAGVTVTPTTGATVVSLSGVPLSKLATQAANTVTANATGSSAAPTAVTLDACTGFVAGVLTNLCPFGPDTIIKLPNSISSPVSAWEGTSTLTTNTAGSEVSKYVFQLLSAGVQVTALDLRPTQILLSDGLVSAPGAAFRSSPSTGMFCEQCEPRYSSACLLAGGTATGADVSIANVGSSAWMTIEGSAPTIQLHADGVNTISRLAGGGMQIKCGRRGSHSRQGATSRFSAELPPLLGKPSVRTSTTWPPRARLGNSMTSRALRFTPPMRRRFTPTLPSWRAPWRNSRLPSAITT